MSMANVDQTDSNSIKATFRERIYEVAHMVRKADFERWLPTLHQLPMTVRRKIYFTEHAEALQSAQTVLACLNLVSITILQKLTG